MKQRPPIFEILLSVSGALEKASTSVWEMGDGMCAMVSSMQVCLLRMRILMPTSIGGDFPKKKLQEREDGEDDHPPPCQRVKVSFSKWSP